MRECLRPAFDLLTNHVSANADLLTRPRPFVNFLTQVTLGCSVLASNLIYNHDRIALAYVDEGAHSCFGILLPLGFHSLDAVSSSLNLFSRRQHLKGRKTDPDIGSIIQQAAGLFETSPRTSFCHIFFISAAAPVQLMLPWIDQAIGFHTITSQSCLPLQHVNHQPGWHISYDVGDVGTCPKGSHFIRKVARVVRQLRTGVRAGTIYNLKLSVIAGGGCHIQSVMDDSRLTSLRAGETWVIPVQISVPAVCHDTPSETEQEETQPYSPLVQDLIDRINGVLMDYTKEVPQPILTAHIEYQHSLLPPSNSIHMETHLTVVRSEHTDWGSSQVLDKSRRDHY